ncbi:ribosome recycling factor [Candidatus Kaiserbacteria bacterium]|nr:ribosome recycling factor [Candidatus Kaiserbacteria bacterium]
MFDLPQFKKTASEKGDWLSQELQGLRTGRATPALLDGVSIEVYGSRMKLNQVANIAVEDARTLYVNPWDKGQVKPIEKAITLADLGISVGSDDKGIRVSFPELTEERRGQLVKLVRGKLEEARIALRAARTKAIADIEKGDVSEDEEKRLKSDVQKIIDEMNKTLEEIAERKEVDLKS